jgi:hypothetical protein
MGPPFAPGNLRQLLPVLAILSGLGGLLLWFFVERVLMERVPVRAQRMFLDTVVSMIPVVYVAMLYPLVRAFAGRLRMIHRPQSADLAELALLPGLGGATALANYCQVLFGRPLRMLVAIAVLMGGIAAVLAPFTLWILLMLVLVIAGITVMELARYLALGRPYVQNIVLEALASMACLTGCCAAAITTGPATCWCSPSSPARPWAFWCTALYVAPWWWGLPAR